MLPEAVTDEPADLVGFSMGAVVAAATASRYPELISRLSLIAGWTRTDEARQRPVFDTWGRLHDLDPELGTRFGLLVGFSPEFVSRLGAEGIEELITARPPAGTRRQIELDLGIDVSALLPDISAPTLVVGATRDALVPVEHARACTRPSPAAATPRSTAATWCSTRSRTRSSPF